MEAGNEIKRLRTKCSGTVFLYQFFGFEYFLAMYAFVFPMHVFVEQSLQCVIGKTCWIDDVGAQN